jgi:hypothetical protein
MKVDLEYGCLCYGFDEVGTQISVDQDVFSLNFIDPEELA